MSAEQVLEEILDEERSTGEESVGQRLKNGKCSVLIEGEVDKDLFLSACTRVLDSSVASLTIKSRYANISVFIDCENN